MENADSNYHEMAEENIVATQIQKTPRKTPKETKISKIAPKTEPSRRVTRGRPDVTNLNESFDETKLKKTVPENQVLTYILVFK